MWHIATNAHRGAASHRAHSKHGSRHRGFSHPARFEVLEDRLPLTAPAGGNAQLGTAADFGTSDLGGFLMAQNGLEPLPGSASEASGNNPAQIALVGVWGTADPSFLRPAYDYVAFNNPSWIPNDRALTPIPFANNTDLPMNIYQSARSPRGIRNFEIGANTSLAHGNAPPIGRDINAAARPSPVRPRFIQAIEHPLDGGLLDGELFEGGLPGSEPLGNGLLAENSAPDKTIEKADDGGSRLLNPQSLEENGAISHAPLGDDAQQSTGYGAGELASLAGASDCHLLDEAAVDQAMAEEEDVLPPLCPAASELTLGELPLELRDESAGLHTAAASLALGAILAVPRPGTGTTITELIVRTDKKPSPREPATRHQRPRNR